MPVGLGDTSLHKVKVEQTVSCVAPVNAFGLKEAFARLDRLTKPVGSLGRLEEVAALIYAVSGVKKGAFQGKSYLPLPRPRGMRGRRERLSSGGHGPDGA
jgi:NaMN:DMB phosphoribosyltransferase